MEYCEGGTLKENVNKLSREESLLYFYQVVKGMKAINEKKIIHRDIKLENLLLKKGVVKISDFGFARKLTESE